jgi:4-amino-4-deoxy-L-arabinose transferase-like glycosyltransferase
MKIHTKLFMHVFGQHQIFLLVALCVLMLFSLVLRIHHLDFQSLFMDEIHQVYYYRYNFIEIIKYASFQQQPPLDYWMGHIFYYYSDSDFSVRLPAAIFGVGSVLLLTFLMAQFCSWPIAIIFGAIYSLLPFNIYFSQDARPYSISIFFFIAVLCQLNYLLSSKEIKFKHYLGMFVIVFLFLLTRALVPLVTVLTLAFIFISILIYKKSKGDFSDPIIKKLIYILIAFLCAVIMYMPFFYNILMAGGRYVSSELHFSFQLLLNGIKRFSIYPLWQAFVVQVEPLTWSLLITTVAGIILALKKTRANFFIVIMAILLPLVSVFHIFVFQTYTTASFRPPYAIYLAPLCFIFSAIAISSLLEKYRNRFSDKYFNIVCLVVCLLLSSILFNSLVDFKNQPIKSDWRGLLSYMSEEKEKKHVYITHAQTDGLLWDPGLYGMNRYTLSGSQKIIVKSKELNLLLDAPGEVHTWEPKLILFHYRNYYLTSKSEFGIMPVNSSDPILLSTLEIDPDIQLKEFTGFSIFTLRNSTGNLFNDIILLLDKTLRTIDVDALALDLYLSLAYYERICGMETFEKNIKIAKKISTSLQIEAVNKIVNIIDNIKDDELADCSVSYHE